MASAEPSPGVERGGSPGRAGGGWAWRVVGILGEILVTLGVVLMLAVVYELWWTNVQADQAAAGEREELVTAWEQEPPPPTLAPIPAEAFGLMYIPRLRDDVWATPLIEGVEPGDLTKGIGHFPDTALPGEVGNASFAGHRATNGEPLANIDQLQVGDLVHIETAVGWSSYRLTHDDQVLPTDVWVIDAVPGEPPGTVPTEEIMTLITCTPRWGSTGRWVWWGSLVEERTREQGPPADLAALLTPGA